MLKVFLRGPTTPARPESPGPDVGGSSTASAILRPIPMLQSLARPYIEQLNQPELYEKAHATVGGEQRTRLPSRGLTTQGTL